MQPENSWERRRDASGEAVSPQQCQLGGLGGLAARSREGADGSPGGKPTITTGFRAQIGATPSSTISPPRPPAAAPFSARQRGFGLHPALTRVNESYCRKAARRGLAAAKAISRPAARTGRDAVYLVRNR